MSLYFRSAPHMASMHTETLCRLLLSFVHRCIVANGCGGRMSYSLSISFHSCRPVTLLRA